MSCENCGLPAGALQGDDGHRVVITRQAANRFKRQSKLTVWVCSQECGFQALGVSMYGRATHKWSTTLAQVRTTVKRQGLLLSPFVPS